MGIGGGILFVLAVLAVGVACLIWVAIWLPKGFRSRRQGDATRLKRRAAVIFCGVALLMCCFPPFRRIGDWAIEGTDNIVAPGSSMRPVDRSYFGYIPKYAWMGDPPKSENMRQSTARKLAPWRDEWIELSQVRWCVDWMFLCSQLIVVSLFFMPFLAAREETLIANGRIMNSPLA